MTKYKQWYSRAIWRRIRDAHRRTEPLCRICAKAGKTTAGALVDHIIPHRGNWELFIDRLNLQTLCKHCHDSTKKRAENMADALAAYDDKGRPTDPDHPWNKDKPAPIDWEAANKDAPDEGVGVYDLQARQWRDDLIDPEEAAAE